MSNKSKNRTSSTSTQKTQAYQPAQGGINQGLGMASSYLSDPNSQAVYGGQRVADLSANTQQGMAGLANNAGYGQSSDFYKNTLQGDYLNAGNPYISQVQQSVQDATMPGINATFGGRGMAGSTIHQNQLAQGMSNGMASHLFANYENERNRQMTAAGQLPAMYGQQARDQLTAGGIQDQQNQNVINADMARFEQQRTAPIRAVSEAMPYLMQGGQAFGTQTGTQNSTQTTSPSQFSTILGAGMMGLGAASGIPGMFGGGQQAAGMTYGGTPMQAPAQMAAYQMPAYQQAMPATYQQAPYTAASYGYGGQF